MTHISLTSLSDELLPDAEASGTGIAVRPLKEDGLVRQVAIQFRKGGVLPEHDNPGEAMALVIEGSVRFLVEGTDQVHELRAGDLLTVPESRHSVEAVEPSLLLLTFAHPV